MQGHINIGTLIVAKADLGSITFIFIFNCKFSVNVFVVWELDAFVFVIKYFPNVFKVLTITSSTLA